MIKFVDDGSNLIASVLVDKIVCTEGVFKFRSYRQPGRVTRVAKTRVYLDPLSFGDEAARSERYIDIRSVRAICDTEDEARALLETSRQALHVMRKHEEACKREIDAMFTSTAGSKDGADE